MRRVGGFWVDRRRTILRFLVLRTVCRRALCWDEARQAQTFPLVTRRVGDPEAVGPMNHSLAAACASGGRGSR